MGFAAGCQRNKVLRCDLSDVGGNGIMVGWRGNHDSERIDFVGNAPLAADWRDPADAPKDNEVSDCTITTCGAVNHGCVAVYDAYCAGTKIVHTLVAGPTRGSPSGSGGTRPRRRSAIASWPTTTFTTA